jgi:hypothetical protein
MASTRQLQAAQSLRFVRADRNAKAEIRDTASKLVARAVADGTLIKPTICPVCGDADWLRLRGKRVQIGGHHNDYGKPLEVEWLCAVCHAEADKLRCSAETEAEWGQYIPDSQFHAPLKTALPSQVDPG